MQEDEDGEGLDKVRSSGSSSRSSLNWQGS
jgi:hypothetical protein